MKRNYYCSIIVKTIRLFISVTMLMMCSDAWADRVAVNWKPMTLINGETVTATLYGDEFCSWYIDKEGHTYEKNKDGLLTPVNVDSLLLSRSRPEIQGYMKAPHIRFASDITFAHDDSGLEYLRGSQNVLVILVDFPDRRFTFFDHFTKEEKRHDSINDDMSYGEKVRSEYNLFFNQSGYNTKGNIGSVADYFNAQSDGLLNLNFEVRGPYTSAHEQSYYGYINGFGVIAELLGECCLFAQTDGINFQDFVWGSDNETVDFVFFIFAGPGRSTSGNVNDIHPMRISHKDGSPYVFHLNDDVEIKVKAGACAPEFHYNVMNGIGTACHELGHCLGLPDFYDTSDDGVKCFGLDNWSVMASGSHTNDGRTPPSYTAYERMLCGWLEPTVLDDSRHIHAMPSITDETEDDKAYIIYNDNNKREFYLLQNIQKKGWNIGAPGSDLLILHVDENDNIWNSNEINVDPDHQRCTIIPADNQLNEESLAGDPYPGTSGNDKITNVSTPSAALYNPNIDGSFMMNKYITNIKEENGLISFDFDVYQGYCGTEGEKGENLVWVLDPENGVLSIIGSGEMKDFSYSNNLGLGIDFKETTDIPWYQYREKITSVVFKPDESNKSIENIGDYAFFGCDKVSSFTIPAGVTRIGESSFNNCSSLKSISIPQGVLTIGEAAFQSCNNLSSVKFSEGLIAIEANAFDGCGALVGATLPSTVTAIGDFAFSGCSELTTLSIPEGVTSIGLGAFSQCNKLCDIYCYLPEPFELDENFPQFEGISQGGSLHIPNCSDYNEWLDTFMEGWGVMGVETCGDGVLWRINKEGAMSFLCSGHDYMTGYIIDGASSESEIPWAAYKDRIVSIAFDYDMTNIGDNAFKGCTNLNNVHFPNSFVIGNSTFENCSSLTTINLFDCLSVGAAAFKNCSSLSAISITRRDFELDHELSSFSGVNAVGILSVPMRPVDMIPVYTDWIGTVLPEDWTINGSKYSVLVECGEHGTAFVDRNEVFEGEMVYLTIHPDNGYMVSRIAFNKDEKTDGFVGAPITIDDNTTIYVEFIEKEDAENDDADSDLLGEVLNDITACTFEALGMTVAGVAWNLFNCAKLFHEPCHPDGEARAVNRRVSPDGTVSSITVSQSQTEPSYITEFREKSDIMLEEFGAYYAMMAEYFGDEKWLELCSPAELTAIFDAVNATNGHSLLLDDVQAVKPQNITQDELETFVARINHTRARANGLPIAGANRIHALRLDSCSAAVTHAEEASEALGYASTGEMWAKEYADYYAKLEEQSKSVCATITLQFTQKLVMTRQAFRGTLTVFNGHEESPMRDVRLNLVVSDKQGHVATSHEFQINGQSLKGFAGEVDLGSGWTLDAQATGEATILFIPTKYAAPTEPIEYSFGGTLTYIDPFTDLEVTRDLYPVTLTVKPSPNLDLTYFMQRDIMGDNALTTDVVEPMVPAEFALLIHNDGYGDATDVRMTTEQPKIVENEKGLLIDFELLSSQVNGKDKVMALGGSVPADFGTIPAHSTAYAQWMLQASLLGHFTDYNVEATHVTSYGNEDLSLLNEVTIHELIHSLSLTDVDGEPLVGWLVNDVTDANDEPDMLYFSNAETTSVNMLSEEQMNMGAVDNDNVSVTLSVGVAQAGWYYGCLVDPMAGRARIAAVTRQSDGASIDPQNFWLTEYTLVDGKDPIQEYMLHFADTLSTTSETYTIAFEMLPEEMLSVTEFILPDKGDSSIYPDYVTTVGITFSKAIDPATFTIDDLKLTCRGKTIDLNGVTLSTEDNITFTMDLTGLTTEDGYYVLTVQTADITDATGYNGQAGKSVDWTQFYGGLLVLRAESQPAEGGSVSYEETAQKAALRRANENGDAQNESVLEVKVPYNSDGALMAQSAEGFGFGGWYMNDQLLSTESRYTSIFIDHTNLTAQFKQLYFDLTVDWNANRGTVTGAGTGKYSYGSNLSLVATPFEGYRFYQWEVNDEVPDDNPGSAYTHTVTGNATLSPLFLAETSSGLLLGDVKEDGNINVGDYTALVSLIVGTDGGRYLLETADHNGNKKADVGDLATEVNMIMDIGSFAANSLRHMGDNGVVQSEFDPDNRLYGPEMTVKAGDEISVPLFLANKDEVSAFQTDIVLPDGLTLLDVAVAEERTTKLDHNLLVTSSKNGGTIRLLAGSSSNVSYRGAAGAVVMLRLRADEDMEDGEYIYQLKHTVLSSADSQIFHAPDCSMPMRIGNATGILTVSPQAESAKGIYDVAGRKIANEATIDVVNRLPAGVYVVSGRKIVVR